MEMFSKKITTDQVTEYLLGLFNTGYGAIVKGLKETLGNSQMSISDEQNQELIMLTMFAILRPTITLFKDAPFAKDIIGKFQNDIFNKYFKDANEREKFGELFWKRCEEYSQVLKPDNEDFIIQVGQIFCDHFFGEKESLKHAATMMFIGSCFANIMIDIKKFLDELTSQYKIV